MAKLERMRQEVTAPIGPDDIARQAQQGWTLVAVEWERELPQTDTSRAAEEVPFGLRVVPDEARLEDNPAELEVLFQMMELVVQDGPYSVIAEELNRRGYRTRDGSKWTPVSVFQMLPRLIEVGPRIFATREWQGRKPASRAR